MPWTMDTTAMRNVTPIVTPNRVKKLLSFCTLICARARRMASYSGTPLFLHQLLHEILAAVIGGDPAIAEHHHAPRVLGDVGLVRHHDHRLPRVGEMLEHAHDF